MQGGAGGWNVERRKSFCPRNPARGDGEAPEEGAPHPRGDRWVVMGLIPSATRRQTKSSALEEICH